MLNPKEIQKNKEHVVSLLRSTERDGIEGVIDYMESHGFFTSPASTKFHGCYEGGLAKHSLGVYALTRAFNDEFQFGVPENSIIIATLLHDLCKAGLYVGNNKPYNSNKAHPKGHARLSIDIVSEHLILSYEEGCMIQYHMGPWNSTGYCKEYNVESMLKEWGKYPIVRWMYFADEMATAEEKVEEAAA